MLKNLNEGDWVALYEGGTHKFLKVARIEHKFTLSGNEAKTYKKNFVEILMIRFKDRESKTYDVGGNVKCDYIIVDAETGKELDGKHHDLCIEAIPSCHNMVFEDTNMSWAEMIDHQKMVYMFSDLDWRTVNLQLMKKINSIMIGEQFRKGTNED